MSTKRNTIPYGATPPTPNHRSGPRQKTPIAPIDVLELGETPKPPLRSLGETPKPPLRRAEDGMSTAATQPMPVVIPQAPPTGIDAGADHPASPPPSDPKQTRDSRAGVYRFTAAGPLAERRRKQRRP